MTITVTYMNGTTGTFGPLSGEQAANGVAGILAVLAARPDVKAATVN